MATLGSAAGLLALFTYWQTVTWSRASAKQIGLSLAAGSARRQWILPVIIGVTAAWTVAGLTGHLPLALGGSSDVWRAIHSEMVVAWAWAILLTFGVAWWLLHPRPRPMTTLDGHSLDRYTAWIVVAFAALQLLVYGRLLFAPLTAVAAPSASAVPDGESIPACMTTWLPQGVDALTQCLAGAAQDAEAGWTFVVTLAGLGIGILLLRRNRANLGALFLVALGVWAVPRSYSRMVTLAGPE